MDHKIDLHRIVKLLGMIGSAHDSEALSAARKAHQIVTSAGLSWEQVLGTNGSIVIAEVGRNLKRSPLGFMRRDRVVHHLFGPGTILEVQSDMITVAFDKSDTKTIVETFLRRIL